MTQSGTKSGTQPGLNCFVLIKQVPDQGSKAGINPDGTIDRTKAKRMLNPFDRFALQAALHVKKTYGGRVTAISMGPPPATEILLEALEHGVDDGYLLSDRRLAASDTLATAYALHKVVQYLETQSGPVSLVFCGLQTTDGDTAQVGPQIAERLNLVQTTYCEDFRIETDPDTGERTVIARRIIEGGYQWVKMSMHAMVTVANSYHALEFKSLQGARRVQHLLCNEADKAQVIKTITLDDIGADPVLCGLKGSPTIVARTDKVGEIGGSCALRQGHAPQVMVQDVLINTNIREFARV